MKKEDLIQKQDECKTLMKRFLIPIIPLVGIFVIGINFVHEQHRALTGNLGIITMTTYVLVGFFLIGRKTDVKCPLCKKSIQGGLYTPLALTTGKCGHCGNTIIEETKAEPGQPG